MSQFNLSKWLKESAKSDKKDVSTTEGQLRNLKPKGTSDENSITEKKLDDYRVDSEVKTTEQRLEDVRTGSPSVTTEGQLEKSADKHRDESASAGNVPKLEEQRLKNDPVEKQKPKSASETPDKIRIDKMPAGSDGLKLASTKKAQNEFGDFDITTLDEDDRRAKQVSDLLNADDSINLGAFTESEDDIDSAMREFGIEPVDQLDDREWEEVQRDLMRDPDATEQMFREKFDMSVDPGTDEKILSGQLMFDADDPLIQMAEGRLNESFLKQKAIEYLREQHADFMITEDNLDLSHLDAGVIKFLATPAPIG